MSIKSELSSLIDLEYIFGGDFKSDWIYWYKLDVGYIYVSPSVKKITGYSPDLFLKDPKFLDKIVIPEDLKIWKKHAIGETPSLEFRIKKCNGDICWIKHTCQKIVINGKYIGIRAIQQDITSNKQLNNDLTESKKKFKALVEESPLGMAYHKMIYNDKDQAIDYLYIDYNKKFSDLTKLGNNLKGKTISELRPNFKDKQSSLFQKYDQVARTGKTSQTEEFNEETNSWYEITIYSQKEGYFASLLKDITENKKNQEKIRLNEAPLEALLKLNKMSGASQEELTNFALEETVKLSRSEMGFLAFLNEDSSIMTFSNWTQNAFEGDLKKIPSRHFKIQSMGILGEVIRIKKPIIINNFKIPIHSKKRPPKNLKKITRYLSLPIFDNKRIVAILGVANKSNDYDDIDITRLTLLLDGMWRILKEKKMEEQFWANQKYESIGILAGGIAHDFNNFLTAILGNISLVQAEITDYNTEIRDILEEAEKVSKRAIELTKQLLTFAKEGTPLIKEIAIQNLIRDTAQFTLRGINVGLEFDIPDNLMRVRVDEGQICQVLNNLMINAYQAILSEKKIGGKIRIEARNVPKNTLIHLLRPNQDFIRVSVEDNGPGISKNNLSKIFDPYFTTKEKGTGLGLAVSNSIIKKHKGLIDVESKLQHGSTFNIYLPVISKNTINDIRTS
jgi:PAS domain S-box-containing protein